MADDFVPSTADMPSEFEDPEADAELLDPSDAATAEVGFGLTSTKLRDLWDDWRCADGPGKFANPQFFGKRIGGVPSVAVDAFTALESALRTAGYEPSARWAYNCRKIRGTDRFSLHSFGIAIDIDPKQNRFTAGDPFAGKLQRHHVDAVLGIKNERGRSIWSWGGNWKKPDRMHFQLDQGPGGLAVDWSTVPGDATVAAPRTPATGSAPPPSSSAEGENVLKVGSRGKAVLYFQRRLLVWNSEALTEHGADGDYGEETGDWVRRFQAEMGIEATGSVDGVTAALLRGLPD